MKQRLEEIFKKYNITITDEALSCFEVYYKELLEWNRKMNLTSITNEEDVIVKHFLDSVFPYENISNGSMVLDIGAGAGFPSLPLKFIRPDLNITMLDSLNKRITFLKHIIDLTQLQDIQAIHSRIEDFKEKNKFDCVVARAVSALPILIEYSLPFLKVGGILMAYKSKSAEEEVLNSKHALQILGGKIVGIKKYVIEENDRCLIIVKKIKTTDKKYPRGKNLPKIKPL
ncbi:MAG: 16S rRNA (guanine(527)-N(7))-methyltransferase RsmG [Clostridia bacterium]|nr:16S rRNA (guanine(527)-N(7))-methyltransferase RsmG [Clostridia bacterium]